MPIPNLLQKYGIEAAPKTTGVPDLIGTKYKNFAQEAALPTPPSKPGILSRAGSAIKSGLGKVSGFLAGAAEEPTYTGAKGEVLKNLPGEIVRTILPGAAATLDNPELAAEITKGDVARAVPKALGETIVAPALSYPLTAYGAASKYINPKLGLPNAPGVGPGGEVRIPTPIGDLTNVQERIAQEAPPETDFGLAASALKHTGFELLNGLFSASMASKVVNPRIRRLTDKGVVDTGGTFKPELGPKSGQLYEPQTYKGRVAPEAFEKVVAENNIGVRTNYDPKNPIFFQVTKVGADGKSTGQFFQIRPSYMDEFLRLFKGDPTAVPKTQIIPIADVSAPALPETVPSVSKPPVIPPATAIIPPAPVITPQVPVQPKPTPTPIIDTLTPKDIKKDQETVKYENDRRKIKEQLDAKGIVYFENATLEELQKKLAAPPGISITTTPPPSAVTSPPPIIQPSAPLIATPPQVKPLSAPEAVAKGISKEEWIKGEIAKQEDYTQVSGGSRFFEKYPDNYTKTAKQISPKGDTVLADIHDLDTFKIKDFEPREGFANRPKIITDAEGNTFAYLKTPFDNLGKKAKYELSRDNVFVTENGGKSFFSGKEITLKDELSSLYDAEVAKATKKPALPKPEVTPVTSQLPPKPKTINVPGIGEIPIKGEIDSTTGDVKYNPLTIKPAPKPTVTGFAEINKVPTVTPEQLVTKKQVKDMIEGLQKDSVDFTIQETDGKLYMTYSQGSTNLKLRPSALGLVEDNLMPGQKININIQDLKKPGPTFRGVNDEGGIEASLADDLSNRAQPAKTPSELVKRIEQLNKFGQTYAILRRTGALPKKAAGIFRHGKKAPKKGIVHLQDLTVKQQSQYMSTLAHELGHALDYNVNGGKMDSTLNVFGKDLTAEQKKTIINELKAVTDNLVGEAVAKKAPGYYYKKQELLARFLESMFVKPGDLGNLAPTALEMFENSAVENPMIAEYLDAVEGNIDLGERKRIFLPDMRQTFTKKLGTRAGNSAWNNLVRYRAMKQRAKILIEEFVKNKFKNVDDDPELLFQSAESITITENGVPKFGTRDFQYAKDEKEARALFQNNYKPIMNEAGDRVVEYINGERYERWAKTRYTPEQGEAFYKELSPEGKKLINDFTSAKEESVDYFNREVIKDVNKINSNIEGWVHHYWEDKPVGPGGNRLQTKRASAKKQRRGAEGYVQDLQKAMQKALTEIETEKAYNVFIEDFFAQVTEPIAKGEKPKAGYIEVTGDVRKGGVGTPQEMRTLVITKGKAVPVQRARYQMPEEIYKQFQKIKEVAVEATTAMRVMNNINRYWRVNVLFHMGSAATNFISGGIQYSTKILTDFYTEVLTGNLAFAKTRRDIFSMLTVATPKGWQKAPDWVYGGDLSNFYGEFLTEKAPGLDILDKSVDAYADKALKFYGLVERYWKKVIATTENVSDLSKLNMVTKEGLKLPTEAESEILDFINSEVDLFAYDYDNVLTWLQNYQQSTVMQAVKPFAKYPYKYAKHITEMIGAAFDQTLPWQERVAKIMALGTVIAIYAYIREKRKEKSKTPATPESAPASVSTRGRVYIGTDEKGNELFTRTAKYPFLNLTEAGAQFLDGNSTQGIEILNDMVGSVAPVGDIALAAMGYSTKYDQYTPFPARAGKELATFVPGFRILNDIARFFDPYQRKQTTFLQGFTSFYPTTDPDLQKKLRGEIKTIQVPLEGGIKPAGDVPGEGTRRTTTDMYVRNYKNDILLGLLAGIYVNRIDPDVAEAFVTRKEKNEAKEEKKGTLNPFYTQ